MFCTTCGTQVGDQDRFCPKCGSKIGPAAASPTVTAPAENTAAPAGSPPVASPAVNPVAPPPAPFPAPQPFPVPMPPVAALNRRSFFRNATAPNIKHKKLALNILSAILLVMCAASIVYTIWAFSVLATEVSNYFWDRPGVEITVSNIQSSAFIIIFAVLITALLCTLGLVYKHYGFYIPLVLLALLPTVLLALALEMPLLARQIAAVVMVALCSCLIALSASLTNDYKRAVRSMFPHY